MAFGQAAFFAVIYFAFFAAVAAVFAD